MGTNPTLGAFRGKVIDEEGKFSAPAARQFNIWARQLANGLSQIGDFIGSLPGRTASLTDIVQNLTDTGLVNSLDNVNDGVVHGRTLQTALTSGTVDLSKPGVTGQVNNGKIADLAVGSSKIIQNVMNNYSNNATVDSIDNGTNATIRVYGTTGGPGTSWHQFIGSGTGPEIPAFSGTAAYSTNFNVYYDGSYHITPNGFDTLADGILFSGSLTTVASGGGGGSSGGGGSTGAGGGQQRK